MHNEKNIIIVLSVALLAALVLVGLLVQHSGGIGSLGLAGQPKLPAPVAAPVSPDGFLHLLSGQVTAVGSTNLTMSAILPGKTSPSSVTVVPANNASITLQTQKDSAAYAKEMSAYLKQSAGTSTGAGSTAPLPYTSKTISLSDITAGMSVTVTPITNTQDTATNIAAQSIVVYSSPSITGTPVPTPPPVIVPPPVTK